MEMEVGVAAMHQVGVATMHHLPSAAAPLPLQSTHMNLHIPCAFSPLLLLQVHRTVSNHSTALYYYVLDCAPSTLLSQQFHWH